MKGRPVSQGVASECTAPTAHLSAHTWNLQNIEDKRADQPAKKRATPYRIHVLCLLNRRGWKQLIYKKYLCTPCTSYFVQCYGAHYVIKVSILCS